MWVCLSVGSFVCGSVHMSKWFVGELASSSPVYCRSKEQNAPLQLLCHTATFLSRSNIKVKDVKILKLFFLAITPLQMHGFISGKDDNVPGQSRYCPATF